VKRFVLTIGLMLSALALVYSLSAASWLGMVLVGYLQWFYFLPRVIRELRFRFA
jgi:hypothetical protein